MTQFPARTSDSSGNASARRTTDGALAATLPVEFVDIDFTPFEMLGVIEALRQRDCAARFAYVVTPNVDHVVRLQRNRSDLWPAYRNAWMILCDSRILARLAHHVGFSLPVLTGSDLTEQMFASVIKPDDRLTIIGGREEEIEELTSRYGLTQVRHYDPPMGFIKNPIEVAKAVHFITASHARYTFLAVGSPQQEILAYCVAKAGGATGVGLCVGASLDFLTNKQVRAPEAMQKMSLEWLYRLQSDPKRLWRRYLLDGPKIFQIVRNWRRARLQ